LNVADEQAHHAAEEYVQLTVSALAVPIFPATFEM
jgi:hypothetical protein